MRRKARGMEKVENLYRTARAQHVLPGRRDHVVGSGGANRFKPSRPGGPRPLPARAGVKPNRGARRLGVESTSAAKRRAPFRPPPAWWRSGMRGGLPRRPCRTDPRGPSAALDIRGPRRSVSLADPLSDMSQFAAELCEYCADIAPIVPSLHGVPQSLPRIRPSFLRCSAQRLRVRRSHQKES